MLELLDNFSKQRHLHRVRPSDMLVIGYSLAGKTDTAIQVFARSRYCGVDLDVAAYHILLNSLVEEGNFDVVEVVLDQIKRRGHQNGATHSIVMKSLCKQGRLEEAEKYLRALLVDGKECPKCSFGGLVNALCREDKFSLASKLIEEFGDMGILPVPEAYGVWIKSLVQAGKLDSAMEFFKSKKSVEGYIPDVFRYNVLICRLVKENRLIEVCDLLLEMKESQIVPDKVTMNAVLCFLCKAGMMDIVMDLYKMKDEFGFTPHSLVFNYVINTLCGDGRSDEAYQMLETSMKQGYFTGKRTLYILANELCRENKFDKLKDLIMLALELKFPASKVVYENLIRVLCQTERVDDVYLIHREFNRLSKIPSENTYSSLISGFNRASRGDIAARILIEMQEKGIKPSENLFKTVVKCVCEMSNAENNFLQLLEMQCTRYGLDQRILNHFIHGAMKGQRPDLGKVVYDILLRTGVMKNISSSLLMLNCYLQNGKIADALNFFDDLNSKKKVGRKMLSTMVVGLCNMGKRGLALAILSKARTMGLVPSLHCYEESIKSCCSEKEYDDAISLINDMVRAGRKVSTFIGNVLLFHAQNSNGEVHKAWLRSRDQSLETTPSMAVLGEIIALYSGQIRFDVKAEDLEEVTQRCFPLDRYSYNVMLRKLCINKIDEACKLFERLCQKGYQPNKWTYEIIVKGLYRNGRIAEAELWSNEMFQQGYVLTRCPHVYI